MVTIRKAKGSIRLLRPPLLLLGRTKDLCQIGWLAFTLIPHIRQVIISETQLTALKPLGALMAAVSPVRKGCGYA